jgi:septal ring factor EnvC (AmiA/AmiB activator)
VAVTLLYELFCATAVRADETLSLSLVAAAVTSTQADLERNEKRLKSLQTHRPAFADELEKLELELQRYYEVRALAASVVHCRLVLATIPSLAHSC